MNGIRRIGSLLLVLLAVWSVRGESVIRFNGTGQVTLPLHDLLKFGTNSFSFELWFKPNTNGDGVLLSNQRYAKRDQADAGAGILLTWERYNVGVFYTPNGYAGTGGSAGYVPPGIWHHLAVNFDRAGEASWYVDGAKVGGASIAAYKGRNFDNPKPYRIGVDGDGKNPFKGDIDEVRIWNRLRTASEIQRASSAKTYLDGSEEGLVAYYRFNEASGAALCLGRMAGDGSSATLDGFGSGGRVVDNDLSFNPPLPPITDFALALNGVNQSVETAVTGDRLAGDEVSIEYWFKGSRMQSAVRLQSGTTSWIVMGWGGTATPEILVKTGTQQISVQTPQVQDGNWHHVAMTYRRNTLRGLVAYVDGVARDSRDTRDEPIPVISSKVWLGSNIGAAEFMNGRLDEVRIWKRALSPAELLDHAKVPRKLSGREPGLVAHFDFNDVGAASTRERVRNEPALFRNFGAEGRVEQDGVSFGEPAALTTPNPAAAGLWLGEVTLSRVSSAGDSTVASAAGGQFSFNVILHADSNGVVRLLKEVTLMQKAGATNDVVQVVALTDDRLIPAFQGLVKRSGKLVGIRYASPFFQFSGDALPMSGGIGSGFGVATTNLMPASLPAHPFRHGYHPVHKDPRDMQGIPYDVERRIQIQFSESTTLPGEGRDRLKGTYRETIRGLHRATLLTEGELTLERVSLVNRLNNQ